MARIHVNYRVVLFCLAAGCAGSMHRMTHVDSWRLEERVAAFEHLEPDAQLGRGDVTVAKRVLLDMANLEAAISGHVGPDFDALTARLVRARRAYRIAAAKLVPDARAALGFVVPEIAAGDPEVTRLMEQRSEQLLATRQVEHDQKGSYQRQSSCIVARRPFGPDRDRNPELALVVHGAPRLWARCYTAHEVPPDGELVAAFTMPFSTFAVPVARVRHGNAYDFEVPIPQLANLMKDRPFAFEFQLRHVWAPDNVVVLGADRQLHVRPDWKQVVVSEGAFVRFPEGDRSP